MARELDACEWIIDKNAGDVVHEDFRFLSLANKLIELRVAFLQVFSIGICKGNQNQHNTKSDDSSSSYLAITFSVA